MSDRNFGGFIWTNHALQRMADRGIKQGDAWATLKRPDQSRYAATQSAWVFYKTWGNQKIEIVAKQNEKKEWVILSVWSKPVHGEAKKVEPLLSLIFRRFFKGVNKLRYATLVKPNVARKVRSSK